MICRRSRYQNLSLRTFLQVRNKKFTADPDHVNYKPIPKFWAERNYFRFAFIEIFSMILNIWVPLMVPNMKLSVHGPHFVNSEIIIFPRHNMMRNS